VDPIRIELERSGGFAGIVTRGALDTAELSDEEAGRIAQAVARLESAGGRPDPRVPDAQRYEFTITAGGRTRRLVVDDTTLPAEARPLVEMLLGRGAG
jgi:hypothetical protein